MKLSKEGLELIKRYEGLRLKAYKPVPTEKYWTIGYGHYGSDVKEGMEITESYATTLLRNDVNRFECAVNDLHREWKQNQFDALVSFAYNCGAANLKKLVADRTNDEIAKKMILYNKAGGVVLKGLTRRREEERRLFLKG